MADRTSVQQPTSSRRLGRYEVIAEIARGGMGTVLLARLAGAGGFQRLFAIKLLHQHYASDTELVEMLLDEARIAAMIHHPNVVSIQEVYESEEHGYALVMDYIEGFPLWDIIHHMNLPVPARWRVTNRAVLDALNGLGAAHELCDDEGRTLNVVHRDMSPQNILVGVDGIARVVDFGIAKAAAKISTTRVGQVKGKLAYMAPEQARGRAVDGRTDLFSLGTVLWETLTGQRLFKARTDMDTYQRVVSAPIPRARDVEKRVPEELDAVCARALERDPAQRFPTAREMARALDAATRKHDLLADSHEVGEWIRQTFAKELAARRGAIRTAAATESAVAPGQRISVLPGGLAVPQIADSVRLKAPDAVPAPAITPVSGVQEVADEWDDSADTEVVGEDPRAVKAHLQRVQDAKSANARSSASGSQPGGVPRRSTAPGAEPVTSEIPAGPVRDAAEATTVPRPAAPGRSKVAASGAGPGENIGDEDDTTVAPRDAVMAAVAEAQARRAASEAEPTTNPLPRPTVVRMAREASKGIAPDAAGRVANRAADAMGTIEAGEDVTAETMRARPGLRVPSLQPANRSSPAQPASSPLGTAGAARGTRTSGTELPAARAGAPGRSSQTGLPVAMGPWGPDRSQPTDALNSADASQRAAPVFVPAVPPPESAPVPAVDAAVSGAPTGAATPTHGRSRLPPWALVCLVLVGLAASAGALWAGVRHFRSARSHAQPAAPSGAHP